MAIHNDTCGCAECGNYGQRYNPDAIHNQSCGCAQCGNYGPFCGTPKAKSAPKQGTVMIAVPAALVDEVLALIEQHESK
jgi:hypothetical protein